MGSVAKVFVDTKMLSRRVVLFAKSQYHPDCELAKKILSEYNLPEKQYEVVNIEKRQDCTQIENYFQVLCLTDTRQVPHLFVNSEYIGGVKEICQLHDSGCLRDVLTIKRQITVGDIPKIETESPTLGDNVTLDTVLTAESELDSREM